MGWRVPRVQEKLLEGKVLWEAELGQERQGGSVECYGMNFNIHSILEFMHLSYLIWSFPKHVQVFTGLNPHQYFCKVLLLVALPPEALGLIHYGHDYQMDFLPASFVYSLDYSTGFCPRESEPQEGRFWACQGCSPNVQYNVFKVCPCYSLCQDFLPFMTK